MDSPASSVFNIFKQLNAVPRPSHDEGRVADWLCAFAVRNGLEYDRDGNNCVVIRKPASPGYEDHEPMVILNHMDMVCVADPGVDYDPATSPIQAFVEGGWMKAKGTSLGADNGMGLSMALAVLQDDSIKHPALEVLTTTNEEDGMSGAEGLDADFIKGRKVLNLDSEDYDTITVGAAGAYLQTHRIAYTMVLAPAGYAFFKARIDGGLGGHSGVDINKGRGNANKLLVGFLKRVQDVMPLSLAWFCGGQANASIASSAEAVFGVPAIRADEALGMAGESAEWLKGVYGATDPDLSLSVAAAGPVVEVVCAEAADKFIAAVKAVPAGVVDPAGCGSGTTPVTSNNIGMVRMEDGVITVSTHTRSFIDAEMVSLGESIKAAFDADTTLVMSAPAWRESKDSQYITMVSDTFQDVLGFRPAKVEMHFVLEAGYYVRKYPGISIACIGPRIVCPHSTKERVEISTVENIWKVVKEILERL
ncbi:MAG: beta-Ala-His dipeptidase [Bacteroidia bacterium]|nr:beta-Ala-His dipeptidase [Bacteroidia bacterium]